MAKNFTQFTQISGEKTSDQDGNVTKTTMVNDRANMHVVGYETNQPEGERRFTIDSILLAGEKSDVGLEFVDNESKETMFTDSTFTGNTTADNLKINGDLEVVGTHVTIQATTTTSDSLLVNANDVVDALVINQSPDAENAVAKFNAGSTPALHIDGDGSVGVGITPDPFNDGVTMAIVGDPGLVVYGSISSDDINGRNLVTDGDKLDTIETNSDQTCRSLSNVSSKLIALQAGGENVVVEKGLDLLEDGDTFKKVPTLSAAVVPVSWLNGNDGQGIGYAGADGNTPPTVGEPFYGVWDASMEKLYSIETQADKTAAHSGDIVFNEIPDGPWNGSSNSTFVKMTSAERESLVNTRTVDQNLYNGDDNTTLNEEHIVSAYQNKYPDYWSSSDEVEYRTSIIPQVESSVKNKKDPSTGNPYTDLGDGNTQMTNVSAENVTVESDLTFNTNVHVLSTDSQGVTHKMPGITTVWQDGSDELHFVNGILVKVVT